MTIPWGRTGTVVTIQVSWPTKDVERAVAKTKRLAIKKGINGQQVIGVSDLRNGGERYIPEDAAPRGAPQPPAASTAPLFDGGST